MVTWNSFVYLPKLTISHILFEKRKLTKIRNRRNSAKTLRFHNEKNPSLLIFMLIRMWVKLIILHLLFVAESCMWFYSWTEVERRFKWSFWFLCFLISLKRSFSALIQIKLTRRRKKCLIKSVNHSNDSVHLACGWLFVIQTDTAIK